MTGPETVPTNSEGDEFRRALSFCITEEEWFANIQAAWSRKPWWEKLLRRAWWYLWKRAALDRAERRADARERAE